MKTTLSRAFLVITLLGSLGGCLSVGGKPRGPLDAFVFSARANPALQQDVSGLINMRPDPLEISVVVPPGADKRRLVATLTLNAEATVTVISTGERVVQQNGATANDFSAPVLYSIEVAKEKKPWRYKVTVREAETNARLAQLGFPEGSTLTPAFSPQVGSYTVVVPFATRTLRISARGESSYLKSISFDGAAAGGASAAGNVDFATGQERSVVIETLAEDGVSRERYTITVRRGEPDRNSLLGTLEATEGTLDPAFSPQRTEYSLQVPFAATRVGLRARPQSGLAALGLWTIGASGSLQDRAEVQVAGGLTDPRGASVEFAGTDWLPLILTVAAEDGSKREYLIEVTRADPERIADLSSIRPAAGTLVPGFSARVVSYTLRLPAAVEAATLELTTAGKAAGIAVEPPAVLAGRTVSVPVAPGQSLVVSILVTAEDGTQRLYRVGVTREAGAVEDASPGGTEAPPPAGQAPQSAALAVAAKNLRLGARELRALSERKETLAAQGQVTVRVYRGEEVLARLPVPVVARSQGPNLSVTLDSRLVGLPAGKLVEVETAIPTSGGRYLCYTEALILEEGASLEIPFLLLTEDPRIVWPAVGTPTAVAGYRSQLPPGRALGGGQELEKTSKGETPVSVEISDPKTGALLGRETVLVRSGPGRAFSFGRPLQVPEGAQVAYRLTARARSGKSWQATGTTQVWTTAPGYEGGFAPVLLPVADELREAAP